MATREMKTRFKLEGEQAFKRAMSDAAAAVRVLNSEQKLAAAEFEATGDAQQYAADQARILKEKIEEQKKAVKAAEDAVAALTRNGVEPNSKQMQQWKTKLNDAKSSLKKMESQLDKTETELKDQNSALGKAKTAMGNAEKKVKSLTDEEKLAEAQFEATGDKEQYAATKTNILRQKIEAQKKAVETAEAAIKSMTDNGVDPASDEMQEWKTKLVNAKTQLSKMESQLEKTESEIKDQNSELGKAKTAMSNAEKKVKSLTDEEKLAAEQFKATGDKEQYLADKTRILKEKIQAQKTAVKAAETAIKSLTDNGIDPNSEEVQAWKTKLVQSKTTLLQLQNRLDHVGDEVDEETKAFQGASGEADSLKESIDKVGEKVDFQNVITGIDNITGHIEAVVKAAAKAAKAVWEMGVDAGQWADDLATAANEAGVDVETYQSWQYASRFIDTNVSDIVKSWQDIQKQMKEGNTDYLATLASMGIASRTTSNEVRKSEDIFWDAIDYLHGISDESLRAEKATLLFGNDWRKLNPLINAGSQAYKEMADEGRAVAVVSESNVNALGEVDDAMQDFNARFDKLKYDALAALAPTFKEIAEAMGTAVTSLNEFIASEEGQAALAGLNDALSGLIKSFLGEDGGKGTFEAIVTGAKDAVKKLTDALDWISKNGNTVKDIIIGLGAAWAGLKVTKEVLVFMQLLKSTPLANLKSVFGGGGNGNSPTVPTAAPKGGTPSTGGSPAGGAGGAAATGGAAKVGIGAAADLGLGLAVEAGVVAVAIAPAVIAQNENEKEWIAKSEAAEAAASAAEAAGAQQETVDLLRELNAAVGPKSDGQGGYQRNFLGFLDMNPTAQADYVLQSLGDLKTRGTLYSDIMRYGDPENDNVAGWRPWSALQRYWGEYRDEEGRRVDMPLDPNEVTALVEYLRGIEQRKAEDLAARQAEKSTEDVQAEISESEAAVDAMLENLDRAGEDAVEDGKNVAEGLGQGIEENEAAATDAAAAMADDTTAAVEKALGVESPSKVFGAIGENVAVGLANGIYKRGNDAINAALWLARSVENIVRGALQIHSPSRVFEHLGEFTGEGFAEGLEGSAERVSRAVGAMIGATRRQPVMSFGGVAVSGGGSGLPGRVSGMETDASGMVHVTLVLDEEVLGDVMAPIVNNKIGAKINATRR